MNYRIATVILITISIIGGIFLVLNKSDDQSGLQSTAQNNSTGVQDGSIEAQAKLEPTGVDRYETYSSSTLANGKGTKRVLFFHANWCSTCEEFERQIKTTGVPEGITIIKANYDKEIKLKQKFKVNVQSTFLQLDDNGDVVKRWAFGAGLKGDINNLYNQLL